MKVSTNLGKNHFRGQKKRNPKGRPRYGGECPAEDGFCEHSLERSQEDITRNHLCLQQTTSALCSIAAPLTSSYKTAEQLQGCFG